MPKARFYIDDKDRDMIVFGVLWLDIGKAQWNANVNQEIKKN